MIWPVVIRMLGPPRGKGAGRAAATPNGGVHVYTDARTRNYEAQLRYAAEQQMGDAAPTAQPLVVHIAAHMAVPVSWSKKKREAALAGHLRPTVKPDCNNYSKALDALNGIVWCDDKQIVDEHIHKRYAEQPGLTITIAPVPPPPTPPAPVVRPAKQPRKQPSVATPDLFAQI